MFKVFEAIILTLNKILVCLEYFCLYQNKFYENYCIKDSIFEKNRNSHSLCFYEHHILLWVLKIQFSKIFLSFHLTLVTIYPSIVL